MKSENESITIHLSKLRRLRAPRQVVRQVKMNISSLPHDGYNDASVVFTNKVRYALYAAVIVVVLTGGLSVAAQGTRPGDVLYPVKRSVEQFTKPMVQPSEKQRPRIVIPEPYTAEQTVTPALLSPTAERSFEEKEIQQKEGTRVPARGKIQGEKTKPERPVVPSLPQAPREIPAVISPVVVPSIRPGLERKEKKNENGTIATSSSQNRRLDVFSNIPEVTKSKPDRMFGGY